MLRCSHGLAYENKCFACVSEALDRVRNTVKISAVKTEQLNAIVPYKVNELQIVIDSATIVS